MIIHKRKGKVGISFRRTGKVHYRDHPNKNDLVQCLCFNSDKYKTMEELDEDVARKGSKKKNLPIVIVGDCRFPPLLRKIDRYYLVYNPKTFMGEYYMRLYGKNAFLVFYLNNTKDFDKYKHIMHRTVYLGSLCRILIICVNDVVLPQRKIEKECIDDYKIVVLKDTNIYLPYHKSSASFEYLVPKKV